MKPKTKLQVDVMSNSALLPDREGYYCHGQKRECLVHIGYAIKKRVACMDCGKEFSPD